MSSSCLYCDGPPVLLRAHTGHPLCRPCFLKAVEEDVHQTIQEFGLIRPEERVALGVSGGKDSSVMVEILHTLQLRYPEAYGSVEYILLAIDEGIAGYRGDALECLARLQKRYPYPLHILSFEERYGRTLDRIVHACGTDLEEAAPQTACSFCGILRRNALTLGCIEANARKIATGHNADDNAETILLNVIRGDAGKLLRASGPSSDLEQGAARIKPLWRITQRDVVMYAFHAKVPYHSVECPYAVGALRGRPRQLLTQLSRLPATRDVALRTLSATRSLKLRATGSDAGGPKLRTCPGCSSPLKGSRCQCCELRKAITGDELRAVLRVKS
ncbi:Cytoplasmic tRNA 2-thiolation protein [Giardia muris]|uniref:Cytoplasmic tRNA 2-thiolation protein n=1 Tax=Giardia muris TaxID=5742 RepID=A0A4Z1SMJ8_GIAMU|nr:Cytoplasmic tRNA 2-thiolation protein [Giardia muris]|eukprot:TNJ26912.1 Cytoplasmic tRNA 2-thiolation protein [Giardia muris]